MSTESIDAKISPVLIVEECPQDTDVVEQIQDVLKEMKSQEQGADDCYSIQSYDVNDINVDCGWKDICGAQVHGYESNNIQFGYFPGSFDADKNINAMTPMLAHVFGVNMNSNEHVKTYNIVGAIPYSILTTPKQKLIRIQTKIMPLDDFLNLSDFEQNGNTVVCKSQESEKTHTFHNTTINIISEIYMHAHYNL